MTTTRNRPSRKAAASRVKYAKRSTAHKAYAWLVDSPKFMRHASPPFLTPVSFFPVLATISISLVAAFNDLKSFVAAVDPEGLICFAMLALIATIWNVSRKTASLQKIPRFILLMLAVCLCLGLTDIPQIFGVITKQVPVQITQPPLSTVNLRGKHVADVRYENAPLRGAQMTGAHISNSTFEGSNLSEADLRDAVFSGVNFAGVNLCGADIRGADLRHAEGLRQVVNWNFVFFNSKTRMPPGMNLNIMSGPVLDTGRGLLYMCTPGFTKKLSSNESKF